MSDLNVMMREHARAGLQTQLDAAVTNGDIEAANKITADIEKLAVSTAPKAPPFGDAEIRAAIEAKADWFGVDPRKSGAVIRLGKDMNPRKFATADAFAEALIKAVNEEFKPAAPAPDGDELGDPEPGNDEPDDGGNEDKSTPKKPRRSDGPADEDGGARAKRAAGRNSGPWAKLSDAPPDVQQEIRRQADKFVRSSAPKEQRDQFISRALESHYAAHQRKGKK